MLWLETQLLGFVGVAGSDQGSVVATVKDIAQTVQAVITVVAILVGGFWAYLRFVRGRLGRPRANLTHQVTHRSLENDKVLLRVTVIVENVGNVLLRLGDCILRVQQILPLPVHVSRAIQEDLELVEEDLTEIQWSEIISRQRDFAKLPVQLEPGENDEIVYDFVIDSDIETVKIYTHYSSADRLRNMLILKNKDPLGWKRTTIYDFIHNDSVDIRPK